MSFASGLYRSNNRFCPYLLLRTLGALEYESILISLSSIINLIWPQSTNLHNGNSRKNWLLFTIVNSVIALNSAVCSRQCRATGARAATARPLSAAGVATPTATTPHFYRTTAKGTMTSERHERRWGRWSQRVRRTQLPSPSPSRWACSSPCRSSPTRRRRWPSRIKPQEVSPGPLSTFSQKVIRLLKNTTSEGSKWWMQSY